MNAIINDKQHLKYPLKTTLPNVRVSFIQFLTPESLIDL